MLYDPSHRIRGYDAIKEKRIFTVDFKPNSKRKVHVPSFSVNQKS